MGKLDKDFSFAGFEFPKYVWTLLRGHFAKRIERIKNPVTGGYYHAPQPITGGPNPGTGFYLASDGMPGLRWEWCDEVEGVTINHTGWFSDNYQDEKIRGIIMRLPSGRGFLAGWSMGEGMASAVDGAIYADIVSTAYAADGKAEQVAEKEREYQAQQEKERGIEEARESIHEINKKALGLLREIKTAQGFGPAVCDALKRRVSEMLSAKRGYYSTIKGQ